MSAEMPVVDRSAARAALMAMYTDERVPVPGTVALRCTEHGSFILRVSPPAPAGRVACPPACSHPAQTVPSTGGDEDGDA